MSPIPVVTELENLIRKYEEVCTPLDLLRMIGSASKLEEANILLHERMRKDVYSLFGKSEDGTMLSLTGSHLLQASRVTKFHSAHSCNQYHTDAVVELSEANVSSHGDAASDKKTKTNGKRKRDEQTKLELEEPVYLNYVFTEQTVGAESGSGNSKREKGVSVMESPYKSINLTITVCRGAGGLNKATLLDFQLLTAGCSPSEQQISLQDLMEGQQGQDCEEGEEGEESDGQESGSDEGDGDCEGREGSDAEEGSQEGGCVEGSADGEESSSGSQHEEGGDDEEDQEDTADYYNVNVSTEVLTQLKDWLKYRSLAEQQEDETRSSHAEEVPSGKGKGKGKGKKAQQEPEPSDEESSSGSEGSPYDRDPALGDLLQFLLSFPYVDEAWGIQDLILDHELGGAEEDGSQGGGEGDEGSGSDVDSGDEDKYCYPCSKR